MSLPPTRHIPHWSQLREEDGKTEYHDKSRLAIPMTGCIQSICALLLPSGLLCRSGFACAVTPHSLELLLGQVVIKEVAGQAGVLPKVYPTADAGLGARLPLFAELHATSSHLVNQSGCVQGNTSGAGYKSLHSPHTPPPSLLSDQAHAASWHPANSMVCKCR